MRSVFLPAMLLTVGILTWGCASAGPAPQGLCRSDLRPHDDPLTEFVDSAGLQRGIDEIWPGAGGLVLATLDYDSLGVLDTAIVRTESLPDWVQDQLTRAILASARDTADPGSEALLFVGDEGGTAVRRVAEFRHCPPVLLGRADLFDGLQREGERIGLQQQMTAVLYAEALTSGRVGDLMVRRSSGSVQFDQAAAHLLRAASVRPAMIEGIPVRLWISVPMTFTPR